MFLWNPDSLRLLWAQCNDTMGNTILSRITLKNANTKCYGALRWCFRFWVFQFFLQTFSFFFNCIFTKFPYICTWNYNAIGLWKSVLRFSWQRDAHLAASTDAVCSQRGEGSISVGVPLAASRPDVRDSILWCLLYSLGCQPDTQKALTVQENSTPAKVFWFFRMSLTLWTQTLLQARSNEMNIYKTCCLIRCFQRVWSLWATIRDVLFLSDQVSGRLVLALIKATMHKIITWNSLQNSGHFGISCFPSMQYES